MTIKCLQQCGELCQRRIASVLIVILGVMSFGTILLLFITW